MPTYEYRCKECSHEFEAQQSFTDAALTECPTCGGPLRKVFGNVGITFKGSGFYKTDSRAGSNGAKKEKDKDGASSNGDSSKKKESSSSSDSGSSGSSDSGSSDKGASKKSEKKSDSASSKSAAAPA